MRLTTLELFCEPQKVPSFQIKAKHTMSRIFWDPLNEPCANPLENEPPSKSIVMTFFADMQIISDFFVEEKNANDFITSILQLEG